MNKRIATILGLILVSIAMWALISPTHFVHSLIGRLEQLGYDLQLRARLLTKHALPKSPIAIIDIDNKSLKAEGRWPWPRGKLADLVEQLHQQGVAVIAFDMFFAEPEDNIAQLVRKELKSKNQLNPSLAKILEKNAAYFDQDTRFAHSLASNESVLALTFLPTAHIQNQLPSPLITLTTAEKKQYAIISSQGYISSIPLLQQAATGGGFINNFADNDGITRRAPLIMEYKNGLYPSLALQAVLLFLDDKIKLVTVPYHNTKKIEGIQIGNRIIPTDANAQVIIPYIGKSYSFDYYSATDVLQNKIKTNALAGKIVFVGTSATGAGDLQATSIESPFPGVEIQATIANGILENKFSYVPEWTLGANLCLVVLIGLLAAFFFPYLGPSILSFIIIATPILLFFINNWLWEKTGLILSILIPVILVMCIAILNIVFGYFFETRRREHLKAMFGQYVPAPHIDEMLKSTSTFALRGEDREMSVLFGDIRNFTAISEGMPATELVELLNTFFTPMTEIIFKHSGTIDKYVGDLIMAFWGAPLKDQDHARHAIESALEMQQKIQELNLNLNKQHWPTIKIGIGIHSGQMSVGDMGSRFRRNYTVLGDAVNLASRIEGLTKFYGVDIMVTEATQKNQNDFVFKKLDRVRVKGKNISIEIYSVVGKQADLSPELSMELDLYHQALDAYFAQKWEVAQALFVELNKHHPHTKLYQIYLERVQEYQNEAPPPDWDGVHIHVSK